MHTFLFIFDKKLYMGAQIEKPSNNGIRLFLFFNRDDYHTVFKKGEIPKEHIVVSSHKDVLTDIEHKGEMFKVDGFHFTIDTTTFKTEYIISTESIDEARDIDRMVFYLIKLYSYARTMFDVRNDTSNTSMDNYLVVLRDVMMNSVSDLTNIKSINLSNIENLVYDKIKDTKLIRVAFDDIISKEFMYNPMDDIEYKISYAISKMAGIVSYFILKLNKYVPSEDVEQIMLKSLKDVLDGKEINLKNICESFGLYKKIVDKEKEIGAYLDSVKKIWSSVGLDEDIKLLNGWTSIIDSFNVNDISDEMEFINEINNDEVKINMMNWSIIELEYRIMVASMIYKSVELDKYNVVLILPDDDYLRDEFEYRIDTGELDELLTYLPSKIHDIIKGNKSDGEARI